MTIALLLVALIGFVGLALDLGKLFIVKTELQNSADACALAAARELAGADAGRLRLAEAAGIAAGERHRVLFQGEKITVERNRDVTFSQQLAGGHLPVSSVSVQDAHNMRYVRCHVKRSNIANWFIQVLNLLPGIVVGDQTVTASAVASLAPGQTTYAIPVALCAASLTGRTRGDWLEALMLPGVGMSGAFSWVRYPGHPGGTAGLRQALLGPGYHVPASGDVYSEPGRNQGAFDAWNTRFGIYGSGHDLNEDNAQPDYSGYAYTAHNWSGSGHECRDAASDFFLQRGSYVAFQGNTEIGFPSNPSLGRISTQYRTQGGNRRLVAVPVVNCAAFAGPGISSANYSSWACVLMLHPLTHRPVSAFAGCPVASGVTGVSDMLLEYLGPADAPDSPCMSAGIAGGPGSGGPRVPVLVR